MAAIESTALLANRAAGLAKRSNWAGKESGVIVVFCIVFIVAVGLCSLFIFKMIRARKAAKPSP